jgi:hypothetical protein
MNEGMIIIHIAISHVWACSVLPCMHLLSTVNERWDEHCTETTEEHFACLHRASFVLYAVLRYDVQRSSPALQLCARYNPYRMRHCMQIV